MTFPHAYDPDSPVDPDGAPPRDVTKAIIGRTHPGNNGSLNATMGAYGIQCACLQEITLEHLRLGYHPMCSRRITIVLEEGL